jgi:GST-like protein
MIDFYTWTTPNGHKVAIFLEEAELEYKLKPVNIGRGEQFKAPFSEISPNHKIPAIVDHRSKFQEAAFALFESGAILEYLADKSSKFLPDSGAERYEALQWLYWQMGGFGPMLGQNHHFSGYAPEKIPYAIERYQKESKRLYGVLNERLRDRQFVAGEYSIADMAIYPWTRGFEKQGVDVNEFSYVKRWKEKLDERPAIQKVLSMDFEINQGQEMDEEAKKHLFRS